MDWTVARDLKRKMEAEFLVQEDIPYKSMAGFACYDADAKSQLVEMGVEGSIVHVRPKYYF